MKFLCGLLAALSAGIAVLMLCGFGGKITPGVHAPVIVTAAPSYDATAALRGEERFPIGAQLLIVRDSKAEPLVDGFAQTADADVSFDAKKVVFAGKKSAGDPWAIWETTLADHSVRKIIAGDTDTVRPIHLPDERLVFAQRMKDVFQLVAANLDGSERVQLTHIPANAIPSDVLADGRILFDSTYPLGSGTTPEMYLVYSDGSGVESYRCDHGTQRWGGKQIASGDVVFAHGTGAAAGLAQFTSPLAHEAALNAPQGQYAGGLIETDPNEWLVSVREPSSARASLKMWKQGAAQLQPFFARPGEDLVEPVLVKERSRPHRHPSGLHDRNYGNLLALDARESREGDLKQNPVAVRVDTMDGAGKPVVVGSAPVEADGSFYVKAPADTPIRFALLDAKGKVLREEHGWFWVRKGEQRICVGCHTGPERAAENRVPAVLLRTTTPADLTGTAQPAVAGSH